MMLELPCFVFDNPFPEYACFDSCTWPDIAGNSEVRAHQMARKLRSAGFTPQKIRAELSSNVHTLKLRCQVDPAQNPRRALMRWGAEQRRPSTESSSDYEAAPLLGCPFFLHYPPGSAPGPHSLRSVQDGLRFDVFFAARGLLVDSGERRSSTMLSLLR